MDRNRVIAFVVDKLMYTSALVKTASYAAGNRELLGDTPQCIALALDEAGNELDQCCEILSIAQRNG